jgi:hypothetical protein
MSFWKEPIQSNNQRCDSQNRIVVPNGGYRYPKAKRKMKEETDMTKQEKDNRVPLWERMNLTLEEAAAYTGIGTDKLRELSNRESCDLFYGSVQKGF